MRSDSAPESDSEHATFSQHGSGSDSGSGSESDSLDNVGSRKRRRLSSDSTPRQDVIALSLNVPSRVKPKTATSQAPEAIPTPVTVAETQIAVRAGETASLSFQDLNLKPWLTQSLKNMAIHRPTRIQQLTIPAILEGRDVIGSSRTGSGKTGQFDYAPGEEG